jgi:pyrimidine dimer DNA glycosylase
MRLWTLHPQYLDAKGLVALWREALLAKAVLRGKTRGYRHHPQLARFRAHRSPRSAINAYLAAVHAEATARGYEFDRRKIGPVRALAPIPATSGQIAYEQRHLMRKLSVRDAARHRQWRGAKTLKCHPLFRRVRGPVAAWERP